MSLESLDQFYQRILEDTALQERLQAAPDQDSLVTLAVELGKENGYDFTSEEVKEVMERESRGQEIVYPIASILEPTPSNY